MDIVQLKIMGWDQALTQLLLWAAKCTSLKNKN